MSDKQNPIIKPKQPSFWFDFLGSMNLAITLLVMLALASVIGTLLQQNQNFQDYIVKFGPFWHEVYNGLGLYDVYGAGWFMLVLLFLLVSTGACVVRHTPVFIKDMKEFNENLSLNALKHQPNHTSFATTRSGLEPNQVAEFLAAEGYKTRIKTDANGTTIAGLKGSLNRLGYFFSHLAIIIICIGALLDSNLYLKFDEIFGDLKPETRNIPVSQVPEESWLTPKNFSYRGTVNITEGQSADILFLPYDEGYLVQQLPFKIDVEAFRMDYYDNGMPKSYESDIVLHDPDLDEPLRTTLKVNHPLYYKDFAIYQSSYGDGGTELNLKVYPLEAPRIKASEVNSAIFKNESLTTPIGKFQIEFSDFKMYNIVPRDEEDAKATGHKMLNNGPSVLFRVRNEQGKAWEYENYMVPSKQDGRWFFMSGVRESVSEPFRYLFIPADTKRSKERFFNFLQLVNSTENYRKVLQKSMPKPADLTDETYATHMQLFENLISIFRKAGFDGISRFIQDYVPQEEQEKVAEFYFSQLAFAMQTLYLDLLEQEGIQLDDQQNISEENQIWFEDAMNVIATLHRYGPPLYFEMANFKQIQSSGLQITKSPGKDVVYFGSAFLIIGVFFMFYVRQRRVWVHLKDSEITIASRDNRQQPETDDEFVELVNKFKTQFDSAK